MLQCGSDKCCFTDMQESSIYIIQVVNILSRGTVLKINKRVCIPHHRIAFYGGPYVPYKTTKQK